MNSMGNRIPISDLKSYSQTLSKVQKGERIVLTENGKKNTLSMILKNGKKESDNQFIQ